MGRINRLTPTTTLGANSVIAMDAESGGNTNKVTIQTLASGLRSFGNYATQTDLNRKQDVLTFDDSPEEDSDNPVTSGGIYNAIGSAMSNVYTKAETDNAIAQSTATLKGEDIRLESSSVVIPNNATTKVFYEKSFNEYKFVDLYFAFQGGYIPAVRLVTNYYERKFKIGFFAFNEGDGVLRKCVLTFTSNGRYMDNVVVKVAAGDNGTFSDNTTTLYLVAAVGYKW